MKIVGFNFKKVFGERIGESLDDVKIETGISIAEIKPFNSLLKSKEEPIEVNFDYTINYNPDFAKIELSGTLVISLEQKESKEVLKEWKNKKIPEEFKIYLFNHILKKSTIKAIQIEDELHIPIHINLPSVSGKQNEQETKTNT